MVPMASGSGIEPAVRAAPVIEGVLDQLPMSGGRSGAKQAGRVSGVGGQQKPTEGSTKPSGGEEKATPVVSPPQGAVKTKPERQVSKSTVDTRQQTAEGDNRAGRGGGTGSGKPKVVVALPGRPPPEKSRKGNWVKVAQSRPKLVHYTTEAAGSFKPKRELAMTGANGTHFSDPSGWGTAVHQPAPSPGSNAMPPQPPPPLPAPPHHGSGRTSPSLPDSDGNHHQQPNHGGGGAVWGTGGHNAGSYPRNHSNGPVGYDGFGHDPRWGGGSHPQGYVQPPGGHLVPRPQGPAKPSAVPVSHSPPSHKSTMHSSSGPQIVKAEIPNVGSGAYGRPNEMGYTQWDLHSPTGEPNHWQGESGGAPHCPTDHTGNKQGGQNAGMHHGQGYGIKSPREGSDKVSMLGSVDTVSIASGASMGSKSSRQPHKKPRQPSIESSVTESSPHVVLDVYDSVPDRNGGAAPAVHTGYSPLPGSISTHPATDGEYQYPSPEYGRTEGSGSSHVESVFVKPAGSKEAIAILSELCSSGLATESRFLEQGITNLGNTCFLGSAIQLLLGSGLFCALLIRLAGIKDHLNPKRLPTLCALGQLASKLTVRKGHHQSVSPKTGAPVGVVMGRRLDPIVPGMLSPVLEGFQQRLGGYMGRPEEQDAQEFLLYLLDKIECEILLVKQEFQGMDEEEQEADDSEGWFVAGRNNKASIRRTAGSTHSTILSALFCGTIQSQVRVKHKVPSVTSHRFTALDLDIGDDKVRSVDDALKLYTGKDFISDYRVEGSNQPVTAEKVNLLCDLPPVLLVSLKRYVFTASGMEKIQKRISFEKTLVIPGKFMAEGRQGAQYELIATCSHHGQGYGGDHYTTKVLQPNKCWVHFNDSTYRPVKDHEVAHDTPYLMLYRKVNRSQWQQQQQQAPRQRQQAHQYHRGR